MLSPVRLFVTPWTVCSPPGSSVHGVFQARILEWVAISYSGDSSLLLQGLFLAQGLKLSLLHVLHCQMDSLQLQHLEINLNLY